jgi:hypothetical protein
MEADHQSTYTDWNKEESVTRIPDKDLSGDVSVDTATSTGALSDSFPKTSTPISDFKNIQSLIHHQSSINYRVSFLGKIICILPILDVNRSSEGKLGVADNKK